MKKSIAGRQKKVEGECIIPPAIPAEALPNLMFKRDRVAESRIREYMNDARNDPRWRASKNVPQMGEPSETSVRLVAGGH